MAELEGRHVLLVEDDEDSRFLLAAGLSRFGAKIVEASSGTQALARLDAYRPDVLVSDLQLEDMHGNDLLQRVRRCPGLERIAAVALTGDGSEAQREEAFRAGFAKHLLKPAKLIDLVAAILAVESIEPPGGGAPLEIRELLARVNSSAPCRFTSLLRFTSDDKLSSVWTYDRENPDIDPFPLGLPIQASYCVLVRAAGTTLTVENSRTDSRTQDHPKRDELATYIGVPLRRSDGHMFGTLCSYNVIPIALNDSVRVTLENATREITADMAWILDASHTA